MRAWARDLLTVGLGFVISSAGWAQQQQDTTREDSEQNAPQVEDRRVPGDGPGDASGVVPVSPVGKIVGRPRPRQLADRQLAEEKISIPAGAQVLLQLQHAITTKSANVGDPIFAITTFPYVQEGRMLIPAGTYVQGRISEIKRAGRVKGRAEILFHFTTLIYPNGYTVMLPGAVENVPGMEHSTMKGEEGTIQQDSNKGHEVATAAKGAATGGLIGAAAGGLKGAGIGGLGGAAVGTAIALFSRGKDLRLEQGTAVQMVVQRPIDVDANRVAGGVFRQGFQSGLQPVGPR